MKIDIITCVFSPEPVVSARTSTDLAEHLARTGHRVRVIAAFPNRPAGKVFAGYRRQLWYKDPAYTGFEVLRLYSALSSNPGVWSRFLENISFGLMAALVVLFRGRPDVLYGNTWPIFAQGLLAFVCRIRNIRLILTVQDIYPESLSVQGRISSRRGGLFKLLRWIDRQAKASAAAIVVISEKFKQIYVEDRGIPAGNVHVIPNWIDEHQVEIVPSENHVRPSHGIPDDGFVVMYAGNIGVASGLGTVISAFQDLAAEDNMYLLVAGSGSMLPGWRTLAGKLDNPRVLFHSPWPESETSSMLAAADLFVLPTYGNQSLVSVPSKLITYMLAARPVLCCAADGTDVAQAVEDAGCGWVVPPGNPEIISQKLRALSQKPSAVLRNYGIRGREYALTHMTRSANLPRLVKLIQGLGEPSPQQTRVSRA